MFGYVIPDKLNMFMKDYYGYRAFYCGLCKSIGKRCSQLMRIGTTYDMTFLNVFAHAILDVELEMKSGTCVLNRVQKKLIGCDDEITRRVVDISTILAHYKCVDDIKDDKSLSKKFIDKAVIKRHYKKAKKSFIELDGYINEKYAELAKLESENCPSVDRVADCFAMIMTKIGEVLLGDKYDEPTRNLLYNLGKWVYCADAIDDVDDDFKKGKYNPFLQGYEYKDKAAFLEDNKEKLEFVMMSCYNSVLNDFDKIKVKKYEGILTNVLWYGMLNNTRELLRRSEKCKKVHI
ncbi:MAG: hypothetical protein K2G37_04455 [Clostridia bacterium]|nr:hypothetical protein [Clostridia bacterium]MDE7329423.1 hypothetical protein [Clostridia bacterium]